MTVLELWLDHGRIGEHSIRETGLDDLPGPQDMGVVPGAERAGARGTLTPMCGGR